MRSQRQRRKEGGREKGRRHKLKISSIKKEVTKDPADLKMTIKGYYEQLNFNTSENRQSRQIS